MLGVTQPVVIPTAVRISLLVVFVLSKVYNQHTQLVDEEPVSETRERSVTTKTKGEQNNKIRPSHKSLPRFEMVRKTSDSRSRHKKATAVLAEAEEKRQRGTNRISSKLIQDSGHPEMSPTHHNDCLCLRLKPGLFLPPSVVSNAEYEVRVDICCSDKN